MTLIIFISAATISLLAFAVEEIRLGNIEN